MAFAAGAKIFKDAGETVSDVEQQLSQALVEVENNAAADLKAPLKELYFKVSSFMKSDYDWTIRSNTGRGYQTCSLGFISAI